MLATSAKPWGKLSPCALVRFSSSVIGARGARPDPTGGVGGVRTILSWLRWGSVMLRVTSRSVRLCKFRLGSRVTTFLKVAVFGMSSPELLYETVDPVTWAAAVVEFWARATVQ